MEFTVDFVGKSGMTYRYWSLQTPTLASSIKAEAGNYVFAKQMQNGFVQLYFGVADSLQARIPSHEKWAEARALGVTHVLSHSTPAGEQARLAEERDLIQYWNPALNVQHRVTG
jgi:hypothetical protein